MKKYFFCLVLCTGSKLYASCTQPIPEMCTQAAVVLDTLQSDFTTCCSNLDAKLTTIEQLLDKPCDKVIQITQAEVISTEGNYCLMNDIIGQLTIQASNVTINLNNHTITNANAPAITASNRNNIKITNGTISGCTGNSFAVFFDTCSRLFVSNINFVNNIENIWIENSNEFIIKQLFFSGNSATTVFVNNSSNGKLDSLQAIDNNLTPNVLMLISRSRNIDCYRLNFKNNITTIPLFTLQFCTDCSIKESVFIQNKATVTCQSGICVNTKFTNLLITENINSNSTLRSLRSSNTLIKRCIFLNNDTLWSCLIGQNANLETNCIVQDCIFEKTKNGGGLTITNGTGCLIKNNTARDNQTIGLEQLSSLNNVFESNISMDNTGANFSSIPSITFNPTTGTFSSTPLAQSNISI